MSILRITDDTTQDEIAVALTNMCERAQHEQAIVARYTTDEPTPWDVRHQALDMLLVDWERAPA